jgi:hypothetical protein
VFSEIYPEPDVSENNVKYKNKDELSSSEHVNIQNKEAADEIFKLSPWFWYGESLCNRVL